MDKDSAANIRALTVISINLELLLHQQQAAIYKNEKNQKRTVLQMADHLYCYQQIEELNQHPLDAKRK